MSTFDDGATGVTEALLGEQGQTVGWRLRGGTTFTSITGVVTALAAETIEEDDDRKIQRRCKLLIGIDPTGIHGGLAAVTYEHEFQIGALTWTVTRIGPVDAGGIELELTRTDLADRSRIEKKG